MKLKYIPILLISIFTTFIYSYSQVGTIKGRIYNSSNNEAIAFANLIIANTITGTTSDINGNFVFSNVKPGYVKIIASYVGFENYISTEFMVIGGKTSYVEIPMKETLIKLKEVEIKDAVIKPDKESPLSMRSIGIAEIEKSPGSNRDISRILQTLPGVASTPAYRNDVIVRGGGASENRFYIDDVEIPNLNHFATQGASGGPVGIVNVDFIKKVDFYSGAFPANKGNALSSILDMRLIEGNPENLKHKASIGASDLALAANGPLSRNTTFLFSARRSYLQFLFSAIGLPFLPTYNDFQWKSKTTFDNKNELTIIGIGAIDEFKLNTGIKNPNESQLYILDYLPVFNQWNYATGAVFKHFRKNSFDTYVLSRNMLRNSSYKYQGNNENLPKILDYTSDEIENKFRYEHNVFKGNLKFNVGGGIEYNKYLNETKRNIFTDNKLIKIDYNSRLNLFAWSIFSQISKSYYDERLLLSVGLRMDANSYSKEMSNLLDQMSPRISASYMLSEKWYLNFNTGKYFQRPAYTTLGYRNSSGELVNKSNGIKYIESDHIVGGFDFIKDNNSKLTFELFYKWYYNYPFSLYDSVSLASKGSDYGTFGDEAVTSTSKGKAYGMELYYKNNDLLGFNIIISYTLVRSKFEERNSQFIPSSWDNIHIINTTLRRNIGRNWELGAKWRFVGGAPYTPIDLDKSAIISNWNAFGRGFPDYDKYNSLRLKSFNQLDIRIDKSYYFNNWALMFYLDVQNVLAYKSEQAPIYTNRDIMGNPVIDPNDNSRYILRRIDNFSGNVLPTIGVIAEF
jgi:hypothetical protein